MSTGKIDVSTVCEMFEKLSEKLDKQTEKSAEPTQIDLSAVNALTERLEKGIEEVHKPTKVEHQHRHTIDIGSSKVFLSLVIMALLIVGLSYFIGEQRRAINQYKDNDLKYRYIKMQGQTNEENLYRMERMFEYRDSVSLVRKQVKKYERLVKKQAEKIEKGKKNAEKVEKLRKEAESLKNKNKK